MNSLIWKVVRQDLGQAISGTELLLITLLQGLKYDGALIIAVGERDGDTPESELVHSDVVEGGCLFGLDKFSEVSDGKCSRNLSLKSPRWRESVDEA